MHLRPVFAETDLDRITALIRQHNFGLLVTSDGGMDASHVPFEVAREGDTLVLSGHLAAANRQCKLFAGAAALAVFGGPHAYISPSWYITQPAVPTWDYAAVHIHGHLEVVEEDDEMRGMMRGLSAHDPGFTLEQLPADYMAGMMRGIRAFRLRAERIEAQWKMSQNRSATDRESVIAALRAQGSHDVADLIAVTLPAAQTP